MSTVARASSALAVTLLIAATAVAGDALPKPRGLEPDVTFWQRIFSEVSTRQGFIHDNRHLGIVYETVSLPGDASPTRIRRVSEAARGKYERILRTLGSGQREGLSPEERRVLGLWGKDVSNAELRAAAGRVRFQQGLAERFHDGLVRSGLWREHILQALRANGVPEELVALPHVESSFDPKARSFVGAAGLWQFTSGTGRRYMRIDQAVDERRDPYESSKAAARLLRHNYSVLNSWPLAITAYNHGAGGMRRAADTMGTTDIEKIVRRYDGRAFGFASRNFYVSFLAALEIDQDPTKFFGAVRRASPPQELVVELPDYMRVETLEKAFGVPRSKLQASNPALLPPVWDGAKYVPRGFRLRLPADAVIAAAPHEALAAVPAGERFAAQVPDRTHRVRSGDTLSHIARRYGTTVAQLARVNGLQNGSRIRVGQTLKLPVRPGEAYQVAAEAPGPATGDKTAAGTYTVRRGDTLAVIARRTGVSQRDVATWNGLGNANRIRIGQTLRLTPPAERSAAAVPPAAELSTAGPAVVADRPPADAPSAASLADPSDYLVADNDTVEVQTAETLSHYAEWLEISLDKLRQANGWSRQRSLVLGQRVRLVFDKVPRETFQSRRIGFHRDLQEEFFRRYRIADTTEHRLRPGESVWVLASQKYKVPVWLLRQYNPTLDLGQVRPGTRVVFPRIVRVA